MEGRQEGIAQHSTDGDPPKTLAFICSAIIFWTNGRPTFTGCSLREAMHDRNTHASSTYKVRGKYIGSFLCLLSPCSATPLDHQFDDLAF